MRELLDITERAMAAAGIATVLKTRKYFDSDRKEQEVKNFDDFMTYINQNWAIKKIGEGYFSLAVVDADSEPEYVMKLSHDEHMAAADSWPAFAGLAQKKYKKNGLYPKIIGLGSIPVANSRRENGGAISIGIIEYLHLNKAKARRIGGERGLVKSMNRNMEVYLHFKRGTFKNGFGAEILAEAKEFAKELGVTFEELGEFLVESEKLGTLDVNPGNIAWRANGTTVIFDPISFPAGES